MTGPEVATRIFDHDYRAACERNVLADAEQRLASGLYNLPDVGRDIMQQEIAIGVLRGADTAREAMDKIGRLFGGPTYDAMIDAQARATAAARAKIEDQRDRMRAELQRQAEAAIAAAPDLCGCKARSAIEQTRADWAIFAGALTLVTPPAVAAFPVEVDRQHGACAGRDAG